jgi:hypothetical protein
MIKYFKDQFPLIVSLALASFCLTLFIGNLARIWGPVLGSQDLLAPQTSKPIALDFPLHWTASFLALIGEPASVYDFDQLQIIEKNLTGHGPHPWPYPPTALLIDLPLSLAPYFVSLALWLAVTLGVYLLVLFRIAPHPLTILWSLAFIGTFMNFYFGQNGFLSAALLGGGLLLLENRPLLGGMLLGLLSYKPHIFVLLPLALLLGRYWRALGGLVISGFGLFLASVALFGFDIWQIFLRNIPHTMHNLHTEALWFDKMPSVFAAVRCAGQGVGLAWIFQGLAMSLAVTLVVWFWFGPAILPLRAAALVLATLLFSPHIWYYDLTLLALPLAWFWQLGSTRGWLPGEQSLLILSWIMPLLNFLLVPGPIYLVVPLILLFHRYTWEKDQQQTFGRDCAHLTAS